MKRPDVEMIVLTMIWSRSRLAQAFPVAHSVDACRLRTFILSAFIFIIAGCAQRRPVVDRQPPLAAPDESVSGIAVPEKPANISAGQIGTLPRSKLRHAAERSRPTLKLDATGYVEEGRASWYGLPFHGRRAANGEIYDMHKLTAAHRTLPFETIVRVTNLINGLSADVRITDRGPFVENRIIDLSRAAADALDMVTAGVESVRLRVISGGNPTTGYFTVQVGAFHDRERAHRLRDRLLPNYSPVFIEKNASPVGTFYRVHVGKVFGEEAAYQFGEKLRKREEGIVPFVVRLDENIAEGEADER